MFNLIYANVFFRTRIARITGILQVRGTCFIKGKILDSLNHGEADNSSFFILHSSFFIAMIYCQYSYAILLVYLCYTVGTRALYFSGTVFSICLQAMFSD